MASSGNICIWNAVTKNSYGTLSQGNLKILGSSSSGGQRALSSFGLTSGKWYMEFRAVNAGNNYPRIGLSLGSAFDSPNFSGDGYQAAFLFEAGSENNGSNCKNANDSTGRGKFGTVSYTNTGVSGGSNIFGFALDLDNRKLFISKDGTYFNSGDPANGTNPQIAWTTTPSESIHLWGDAYQSITQVIANWGQDSTFSGNETAGGNADENGFGDFKYSPPTGFLTVCSANLPISDDIDPAGDDGADENPTKQFGAYTYTGNSGSAVTVSTDFQPDLIWIKNRDSADNHYLQDSSRGFGNSKSLSSNATGSEGYQGGAPSSSGAQNVGSSSFQAYGADWSKGTDDMIAWCWRANGGTTASNSDGSITSTVQANTKAGFSIITYTGTGSNATIGHGLSAKPDFIIFKRRSGGAQNWRAYHTGTGTKVLTLNDNRAAETISNEFQNTEPTSSIITLGTSSNVNTSSGTHVAYAWHSVEGYSKFGNYVASGNADGPFVYTGFRPRLLAIKGISTTNNWTVFDTARETFNPIDKNLHWDTTDSEETSTERQLDILSNGFKLRSENGLLNHPSGDEYVFMAWGDVPFKYNNTF